MVIRMWTWKNIYFPCQKKLHLKHYYKPVYKESLIQQDCEIVTADTKLSQGDLVYIKMWLI
jgi:hypothetical protein